MAENNTTTPSTAPPVEDTPPSAPGTETAQPPRPRNRGPHPNQIYALPAPIRTFPLPSFYPNNPLSIFYLVYTWVKQVISPPPAEPSIIHTGTWDPDTRSVHITDPIAVRAFWEQGFYGKGTLSRSEPNWLKREQIRRGAVQGDVSEQRTALRREERRQVKWERARTEQEALERTRREEAGLTASGGEKADATPVQPASDAEPGLLASKSELLEVADEAALPRLSPAQAQTDVPLNVTEAERDVRLAETVVTAPELDEVQAPLEDDHTKDSHKHEPFPDQYDTLALGAIGSVIRVTQLDLFPAVTSKEPSALAEASGIAQSRAVSEVPVITGAAPISPGPVLSFKSPVGPLDLLALPNSAAEVRSWFIAPSPQSGTLPQDYHITSKAPVGPLELLALPNSTAELLLRSIASSATHETVLEGVTAVTKAVESSSTDKQAPVTYTGSAQVPLSKAPVGPLELLALPNSMAAVQPQPAITAGLDGVTVNDINTMTLLTTPNGAPREASVSKAPVGPLELLALPNSLSDLRRQQQTAPLYPEVATNGSQDVTEPQQDQEEQVGNNSVKTSLILVDEDVTEHVTRTTDTAHLNGHANGHVSGHASGPIFGASTSKRVASERPVSKHCLPDEAEELPPKRRNLGQESQDGDAVADTLSSPIQKDVNEDVCPQVNGITHLNGHTNGSIFQKSVAADSVTTERPVSKHGVPEEAEEQPPKRRKSVRFSPTVEATTFQHRDPPSSERSVPAAKVNGTASAAEAASTPKEAASESAEASLAGGIEAMKISAPLTAMEGPSGVDATTDIENKEHLQLSAEEAFFLSYGIGALSILDPATQKPISPEKLLELFRSHSYFPPSNDLKPNDPFLVHYVVYHHFRSLGWVPRHGIKFGVDWMLYTRGPVFDHAEFGLIVQPAYSHSWWKENGQEAPRKSWHWLHGVNRVLSHVLKSLVLVYVDIPPPHVFDAALAKGGISEALKEYKVSEFMVRRWSSNRNR